MGPPPNSGNARIETFFCFDVFPKIKPFLTFLKPNQTKLKIICSLPKVSQNQTQKSLKAKNLEGQIQSAKIHTKTKRNKTKVKYKPQSKTNKKSKLIYCHKIHQK